MEELHYESYNTITVEITKLEPDPFNIDANGALSTEDPDIIALSESMRKERFFGTIVAYEIESHKYRIESGHRRYYAALLAGFKNIPISVSEPPKNDLERKMRLDRWNDYSRNRNPIFMARNASFKFQNYTELNKQLKAEGKPTYKIIEQIAKEMNISTSQVDRYRRINKLIPKLVNLIIDEKVNWAALIEASVLDPNQQQMLYQKLSSHAKLFGYASIDGKIIRNEIDIIKHIRYTDSDSSYHYDRSDLSFYSTELRESLSEMTNKEKRFRRKDGTMRIHRSAELLSSAMHEDALIKEADKEQLLQTLKIMKKDIDTLIKILS